MATLSEQVRGNLVALVSLMIALTALGYNTWRNEITERNRNLRASGFALLTEVGSLQQVVFYAHFGGDGDDTLDGMPDTRGDPRMGWADVLTIVDLSQLMTRGVAGGASSLRAAWQADWELLDEKDAAGQRTAESIAAHRRIDESIDALRAVTLAELTALD